MAKRRNKLPLPPYGGADFASSEGEEGDSLVPSSRPTPLPILPNKGGGGASGDDGAQAARSAAAQEELVLLGDIGAAQGLKGEVRIRSYTADPLAIGSYGLLTDEQGGRPIEIAQVRQGPKGVIARVKGVSTREQAERLKGRQLYVPRSRLPERDEDEWYYSDLIGLAAQDADGAPLGTVLGLHNFGAGDVIEIKRDGERETLLLPFTREIVPVVDIAARRIVVHPPDETADETADETSDEGD